MLTSLGAGISFLPLGACGVASPEGRPAPDGATDAAAAPPNTPATPEGSTDAAQHPDTAAQSDSGDGGDAGPADYCAWRTTQCKRSQAACDQERACFASMRPGAGEAVTTCALAAGQCNKVDDCVGAEGAKFTGGAAAQAFASACASSRTACGSSVAMCTSLLVFPDAALADIQACFAGSCAQMGACVSAELAKLGCQ